MTPIPWNPDRKTLSGFSEAWMFAIGMVAAPLALLRGHPQAAALLWGGAIAGRAVGLVRPTALRPVFLALTLATYPIGWVVSNLALALTYFLVVTPIGAWRRRSGRDPLARAIDQEAESYWIPYRPDGDSASYFRQF